ncbi:MAG: hypothetical protein HQ567_29670 [Candidatus Nealsonbacteria bacterium]|nr:hypothetical protein [Candidatus Nealsonbacteria bacterium]
MRDNPLDDGHHNDGHHNDGSCCCRRDFLATMGVAAGTIAFTSLTAEGNDATAPQGQAVPRKEPAVVRGAFLYPPSDSLQGKWWSWPGNDFDAEGRQRRYMAGIREIEKKLDVRIVMEDKPLDARADVARFAAEAQQAKPDALLLIPMKHSHFSQVDQILKQVSIPTVIYSCLGVKHGPIAQYHRAGVHIIQSLDNLEAIEFAVRMIRTKRLMQQSRIVSVAGAAEPREGTVPLLGTTVRSIPLKQFVDAYHGVEITDAVRKLAQAFQGNAQKVLEPAEPEILAAARTHFAVERILRTEQGDAITMDCLRRGELMPCMSFMTLRDKGIAAGCENDLSATLTLMLVQHLFDRPGFQHNPAFETEANHYFASHCTSASKLLGTTAPQEPHLLRNFAHTNDPTCVPQVLWREGEEVTMAHYQPDEPATMYVYSGKVVKSYAMPPVGGCRTNVEITINELDDVCDVHGHHNVLFYGNHARRLKQFARFYDVPVAT